MSSFSEINGVSTPGQPLAMIQEPEHTEDTGGAKPSRDRRRRISGVRQPRGAHPYDELLWRLQAQQSGDMSTPVTIGLVGSERRCGVTTLAANLAVRAGELHLGPVLLVEANWEGPRLSKMWRLPPGPGLADFLAGQASYVDCLRAGPAPDLEVLPAGALRRGDSPHLEPGVVDALMAEACADHGLVLFDLSAAENLQQTLMVAKRLDQVLLVVRAESTRQRNAQKVADRLLEDGVPLTGVVLNRRRRYVPRWLQRWL
jgi:Mrp family chromosome partitioning ATPase